MSKWQSYLGSVLEGLNDTIPGLDSLEVNSPIHMLQHCAGRHVDKSAHKIDGNGAQNDNLFQVTGSVQILLLQGHVDTVTDATTFSGVKFELYDSAAATDITGTVDCSGAVVGAMIYKRDLLASALRFLNPTAGLVEEAAANKKSYEPFFAIQKTGGANTYIRIAFTGDANTDIDMDFELHFVPISHDGDVVAV